LLPSYARACRLLREVRQDHLNPDTNFREATTCWADQVVFAEIDAADNVDARVAKCRECDARTR